jgi:hypothetical protein
MMSRLSADMMYPPGNAKRGSNGLRSLCDVSECAASASREMMWRTPRIIPVKTPDFTANDLAKMMTRRDHCGRCRFASNRLRQF